MRFSGLCIGGIVLIVLMHTVVSGADWPQGVPDICGVDQWVGETCGPMPEFHYLYFDVDWGEQGQHIIVCDCGSVIPARGTVLLLGYDPTDESGFDPNLGLFGDWEDDWSWNNCSEKGGDQLMDDGSPVSPYYWTADHKVDCEFDPCYFTAPTCEVPPTTVGLIEVGLPKTDCETINAIDDGNLTVTVNVQAYTMVTSTLVCTYMQGGMPPCDNYSPYCHCRTNCDPCSTSCVFEDDEIEGGLKGKFLPTLTYTVDVLFPDGNPCKKK